MFRILVLGYLYDQLQCQRNPDAQIKDLDVQFSGEVVMIIISII